MITTEAHFTDARSNITHELRWQRHKKIRKLGWPVAIGILLAVPMSTFAAQAQKQSSSDVRPLSVTPAVTFSSPIQGGTRVTLSDHGNVIAYNSPFATGRDYEHIGAGAFSEGYVLCYSGKNAFDTEDSESGFGPASVSGVTATTATVTRNTSDNFLALRQDFGFNGQFRSLRVTMTITNPRGSTVSGVTLRRQVDFDVDAGGAQGFTTPNLFGRTSQDRVFAWNDPSVNVPSGREGHGMMLRNVQTPSGVIPRSKVTANILDSSCNPPSVATPVNPPSDYGATLQYNLGSIGPFASKAVTLVYERF